MLAHLQSEVVLLAPKTRNPELPAKTQMQKIPDGDQPSTGGPLVAEGSEKCKIECVIC